ncbi:MAG TPA: NADH-quinone oxidoreductase subunit M [Deinococcales bacterium]|nr:NADH-quinone oxidoreductase subunit M [Deinococcales bacterium]
MIHLFLFLPLATALLVALLRGSAARAVAVTGAAATLAAGLVIWAQGLPVQFRAAWLPGLGVNYSVQIDGASLLLALVTAFMTLVGLYYAATRPGLTQQSGFLALVLAMETGLLGIFAARDLILFYVFFEATLIPSLFLLGVYGRANRVAAATKFALYTVIGGLLMLAAILGARFLSGAESFELSDLLAHRLPLDSQRWLLLGFLAAFAVKLPLFPLHTWLPDFHAENHPSGVADLMGTLYKVGGYGLFRFALPLFPDAALELRPWLMFFAAFTAIYAAWAAFAQRDWKRLMAYSSLSHMGLVGLGLFSLHPAGMTGALYLLAFQGVYTGGLFLVVGMLEERLARAFGAETGRGHGGHGHDVDRALTIGAARGLAVSAPALAGLTLLLWFASIGVPGLAGFVGEFSIFLGAYQASPWITLVGLLATIAAGAYALTAYQRTWFEQPEAQRIVSDVRAREWPILAPVVALVVLFGLYSAPALRLLQPSVTAVQERVSPAGTVKAGEARR